MYLQQYRIIFLFFSTYYKMSCATCREEIGRRYKGAVNHMDSARGMYTLFVDKLSRYVDKLSRYVDKLPRYVNKLPRYINKLSRYVNKLSRYVDKSFAPTSTMLVLKFYHKYQKTTLIVFFEFQLPDWKLRPRCDGFKCRYVRHPQYGQSQRYEYADIQGRSMTFRQAFINDALFMNCIFLRHHQFYII